MSTNLHKFEKLPSLKTPRNLKKIIRQSYKLKKKNIKAKK